MKVIVFYKNFYNFTIISGRDTKPTGKSSLTFDLENKLKVKAQGHTNS
jgi:hypothetical protein